MVNIMKISKNNARPLAALLITAIFICSVIAGMVLWTPETNTTLQLHSIARSLGGLVFICFLLMFLLNKINNYMLILLLITSIVASVLFLAGDLIAIGITLNFPIAVIATTVILITMYGVILSKAFKVVDKIYGKPDHC